MIGAHYDPHSNKGRKLQVFFGSSLVSLDDELSNILAIGSDRDPALRKRFHIFFSDHYTAVLQRSLGARYSTQDEGNGNWLVSREAFLGRYIRF